jgi:AcrR family transcriptional regulator
MGEVRRTAPLTTEEMVTVARGLIDEGGIEACSMRALAGRLGVQPPALYRRVRDKDELLSLVLADALSVITAPETGTWQERVAELMRRLRGLVREHPQLLALYLHTHLSEDDANRTAARGAQPMLEAGFSDEAATFAVTVLAMYTLGMASVASSLEIDDDAIYEFGLLKMIEGLTPEGDTWTPSNDSMRSRRSSS